MPLGRLIAAFAPPLESAAVTEKLRIAVVGLGKMGLSHHALVNAHPDTDLVAICDATGYLREVLGKYTGVEAFADFDKMLDSVELDAVLIATPSASHAPLANRALDKGLHVFCEKPFTLKPEDGAALAARAAELGLVPQVGYPDRFVGAFREAKRLLDAGAIGSVTMVKGEAYGPVVMKPKGSTWRSRKEEGGGALYDYAAHPINLVNWYLGAPSRVGGSVLKPIFSKETDDEVLSTLFFDSGSTAQISINWSDESQRKMATTITAWGTAGWIQADRQECKVFLRGTQPLPDGYEAGWNVRYTTDLTEPVWFYLRGEEYSAQIDHFVKRALAGETTGENDFASANETDRVLEMIVADASGVSAASPAADARPVAAKPKRKWFGRR